MNRYPQIHADNGPLVSSRYWSDQDRTDTEVFFHHKEKAEIMMTAASSWYGGDFMEFGSGDLNTFRDFLTAYNVCGMTRAYSDMRFYAFDVFGKLDKDVGDLRAYFDPYTRNGDRLGWHQNLLERHMLYTDKCYLVQGLFEDTLTKEFKEKWRDDKAAGQDHSQTALHLPPEFRNSARRQIGFAVFEWIFDAVAENSYVYMDEGLQSPEVLAMWSHFTEALCLKRNIGTVYIRNAGGFGALYRLYPLVEAPLCL
jgi:hypothetical protein